MTFKIFSFLSLLTFGLTLQAQVGDSGAPIADFETNLMCWDNSGTDETIVRLSLYVVGTNDAPRVVTYHNLAGQAVTPSVADLTWGACSGDVVSSGSDIDYELIELCDDGTPFIRIVRIDGADDSTSDLGDYDYDFAAYTVSGSVTTGPCVTTSNISYIRQIFDETSGTVAAGKQSVTVCNTGIVDGELTVGGNAAVLLPGECWFFSAHYDPVTRTYYRSAAISWTAAGVLVVTYAD
ncbi:MAG: hypothetical protein AAF741_15655 [Bacteroidota bacterium]